MMKLLQFVLLISLSVGFTTCSSNENPADNQKEEQTTTGTEASDQSTPPSSTPQTYASLQEFWPAFQREIAAGDMSMLAAKISFPLKGAQFLIGKPTQEAASKEEVAANLNNVFDAEAKAKIQSTAFNQLEKTTINTGNYAINGLDPNGYRLIVNYDMEEETESSIIYVFGKTPVGYKLIGIDFAG